MSEPSVLIEPEELARLLDQEPRPVLADVRWQLGGPSQRSAYEDAHLPGARWVDLESVLTAPPGEGGRHPLPPAAVFEDAMQQLGLDAGQLLVAYDSANSLAAARLWWLLTDSGHAEVRVLNGGLAAWQRAGLEIERGWVQPVDRGSFRAVPGTRRQIDADEIEARLGAPGIPLLVDVRAPERYSGPPSRSTRSRDTFRVRSICPRLTISTPTAASGRRRRSTSATPPPEPPKTPCSIAAPASPPLTVCWPWSRPV